MAWKLKEDPDNSEFVVIMPDSDEDVLSLVQLLLENISDKTTSDAAMANFILLRNNTNG